LTSNGKINSRQLTDEMFYEICSLTPWVLDTTRKSIRERIYYILNEIDETPKCPECSKPLKFKGLEENPFLQFCSTKCSNNSSTNKENKKKSNLEKYGVEFVSQKTEFKEKAKQTNLERYGVEYISQSSEIKEKKKQTSLEKYGTETPLQCSEVREKIRITNLERYGVENVSQSQEIKELIQRTCQERYGVDHNFLIPEVQESIKASILRDLVLNIFHNLLKLKKRKNKHH